MSAIKPSGIVTLDLHGKNIFQAKTIINSALRNGRAVYTLRIVHGFNRGTELRDMLRSEYISNTAVKRIVHVNDGVTDLILKELF